MSANSKASIFRQELEKIRQLPGWEKATSVVESRDKSYLLVLWKRNPDVLRRFGRRPIGEIVKVRPKEWALYYDISTEEFLAMYKVRFGYAYQKDRHRAIIRDIDRFVAQGKSYYDIQRRIAEEYGISQQAVFYYLREAGVRKRTVRKILYLVTWWEDYECTALDSIWTQEEDAKKRVEFLKKRAGKYTVLKWRIVKTAVDEPWLFKEAGVDDEFAGGRNLL